MRQKPHTTQPTVTWDDEPLVIGDQTQPYSEGTWRSYRLTVSRDAATGNFDVVVWGGKLQATILGTLGNLKSIAAAKQAALTFAPFMWAMHHPGRKVRTGNHRNVSG